MKQSEESGKLYDHLVKLYAILSFHTSRFEYNKLWTSTKSFGAICSKTNRDKTKSMA
jgi:hypothetical protein